MWFAGEHTGIVTPPPPTSSIHRSLSLTTAPFIALGTTTGAYWAGEGVGRRICRSYGRYVQGDTPFEEEVVEGEGEAQKKDLASKAPDAAELNGVAL